ncbi:MAG: long-chain-fatty-acid--CoA ligase [Acidobacteria bacterium]|nr:long-chain-fatty-acid--CoA ligase [Acidobacteriota bacterium]
MLIPEALFESCRRLPQKTALYFRDQSITYSEVADRVRQLAAALKTAGVKPNDRVAICLNNSPEFVYAYYAVLCCRGVVVPINTFLVSAEIQYIFQDSEPAALITSSSFWSRFEPLLGDSATVRSVFVAGCSAIAGANGAQPVKIFDLHEHLSGKSTPEPGCAGQPGELAELIYTSGTTGKPKGVMLSHQNLLANTRSVAEALAGGEGDTYLMLLPVFHITSQQVCLLTPIYLGASISILEKIDRAELAHALQHHRPSIFIAVPSIYNMLSQLPAPPPHKNPVRLYVSGGAPLPLEIYRRFEENYGVPIYQGYGLTEASPVVSWNVPAQNRPGSSGRALKGVEIKIIDASGQDLPPGAGHVGEICVKGELVMLGYYKQPEATSEVIEDGWLRTGDVGYLDSDGFLFIVDRKKEMLIFSGMNIYPREIEEVLHQHPDVMEAAVVGVKDAARGEIPLAFVVPRPSTAVDAKQLQQFSMDRLARYKVPRRFHLLTELPRTGSGKTNRALLREEASRLWKGGSDL